MSLQEDLVNEIKERLAGLGYKSNVIAQYDGATDEAGVRQVAASQGKILKKIPSQLEDIFSKYAAKPTEPAANTQASAAVSAEPSAPAAPPTEAPNASGGAGYVPPVMRMVGASAPTEPPAEPAPAGPRRKPTAASVPIIDEPAPVAPPQNPPYTPPAPTPLDVTLPKKEPGYFRDFSVKYEETLDGKIVLRMEDGVTAVFNPNGKIGEGGQSKIYKAGVMRGNDPKTAKVAVIKLAPPEECRVLKMLGKHPCVTEYLGEMPSDAYDEKDSDGKVEKKYRKVLAIEYRPGLSLEAMLTRSEKPMTVANTAYVAYMVLGALGATHSLKLDGKQVVHRDVKTANIQLSYDPDSSQGEDIRGIKVSLLDWGIVKDDRINPNVAGQTRTAIYASPQQIVKKWHEVDLRTDLRALGAALYEARTLQPYVVSAEEGFLVDYEIVMKSRGSIRKIHRKMRDKHEHWLHKQVEQGKAGVSDFYYPYRDFMMDRIIAKLLKSGGAELIGGDVVTFRKVPFDEEEGYKSAAEAMKDIGRLFPYLPKFGLNNPNSPGAYFMRRAMIEAKVTQGVSEASDNATLTLGAVKLAL